MTISQTLRFMLKKYSSGGDPHPNRAEFNLMIDAIENNGAMFSQGITDARPPVGKRGRFYWDEAAERLYYDNGATWKDMNPNGGGGAGRAIAPGVAAAEGVSARAARADHTHALELATTTTDGAMSKADKAKLDAATTSATAGAIARRDADGRLAVATPADAGHAATKSYVDGLITETADYVDQQIDTVSVVCTSTTRPAEQVRFVNQRIYETDTKRTRMWDGAQWQLLSQPSTAYTPAWAGFQNLGTGYTRGGEYSIIGPNTVRASLWVKAGEGSALGTGRLTASLPLPSAGGVVQLTTGANFETGPAGLLRALFGVVAGSTLEAWAWPDPAYGTAVMRTPGSVGYPFAPGAEIHFTVTYQCAEVA